MSAPTAVWLRAVPIAGWAFLGWGLSAVARGHAPTSRFVRAGLWIDGFLSIVVHAVQIPAASKKLRPQGYSATQIYVSTMVFGATWYRTLSHGGTR